MLSFIWKHVRQPELPPLPAEIVNIIFEFYRELQLRPTEYMNYILVNKWCYERAPIHEIHMWKNSRLYSLGYDVDKKNEHFKLGIAFIYDLFEGKFPYPKLTRTIVIHIPGFEIRIKSHKNGVIIINRQNENDDYEDEIRLILDQMSIANPSFRTCSAMSDTDLPLQTPSVQSVVNPSLRTRPVRSVSAPNQQNEISETTHNV